MGLAPSCLSVKVPEVEEEFVDCLTSPLVVSVEQARISQEEACTSGSSAGTDSLQENSTVSSSGNGASCPSTKKASIDSLPDEVLVKILAAVSSSADCPADVVAPALTCRKWRRAARDREVLKRTSRRGVALHARQWCDEAYLFLRCLAGAGCLEACFILGMILFYCVPAAQMDGARLLIQTAKQGHGAALHASSIISFNGSGWGKGKEQKDVKMGVALCARSAAMGHVDAMRELGHCLMDGFGLKQDQLEAWRMMVKAHAAEASSADVLSAICGKRKASVFDSSASKRVCKDVFGNSLALSAEEQQAALHQFKAPPARRAAAPSKPSHKWAPLSASSTPPTPPGPAGAPQNIFSRESAQKLLVETNEAAQPKAAESMDYLKAVELIMFSGKKPSDESLASLKSVLSGLQTSNTPVATHPANQFIKEWYGQEEGCKARAVLPENLGFCSRESCGRPETRPMEFWRCSTCFTARYCSRSCQLHDWRSSHCKECKPAVNENGVHAHAGGMRMEH